MYKMNKNYKRYKYIEVYSYARVPDTRMAKISVYEVDVWYIL